MDGTEDGVDVAVGEEIAGRRPPHALGIEDEVVGPRHVLARDEVLVVEDVRAVAARPQDAEHVVRAIAVGRGEHHRRRPGCEREPRLVRRHPEGRGEGVGFGNRGAREVRDEDDEHSLHSRFARAAPLGSVSPMPERPTDEAAVARELAALSVAGDRRCGRCPRRALDRAAPGVDARPPSRANVSAGRSRASMRDLAPVGAARTRRRALLRRFGAAVAVEGAVPSSGAVLVVTNHPGAYDSIAMLAAARSRRRRARRGGALVPGRDAPLLRASRLRRRRGREGERDGADGRAEARALAARCGGVARAVRRGSDRA